MLEVSDLHAYYGDSYIVQGASLSVGVEHSVALLGRNGAGKTTLLKSIMNAGPRVRGAVSFEGRALGTMPTYQRARLGLGLVPEDRRIYPHLTVRENLEMGGHAMHDGGKPYSLSDILGAFPMLEEVQDHYGYQLSGGQQQMLSVARALVGRPLCLLLDEPTEGLAPLIVQALADQVNRMREANGMALLVAEQNIAFARACTQYVYVIDSGRVVFGGTWASFDAQPEMRNRYLAV